MYKLKIHYNIISEDHIDWVKDQILYKSIQFSMSEFRDMIHELMRKTQRMLMKNLIFEDDNFNTLRISWASLRDNLIENIQSWNFIQNKRNQLEINEEWWLYN